MHPVCRPANTLSASLHRFAAQLRCGFVAVSVQYRFSRCVPAILLSVIHPHGSHARALRRAFCIDDAGRSRTRAASGRAPVAACAG
jgi:hypothetical protein